MKLIDVGQAAHHFNSPTLVYAEAPYRYRVRLPMGSPVVDVHRLKGGDRSTITFSSWTKAVVALTGPTSTIDRIFERCGG